MNDEIPLVLAYAVSETSPKPNNPKWRKEKYLSQEDNQILNDTLLEFGTFPQEFYCFWEWNNIQLDGDFSLQEMKVLTEAMIRMENRHLQSGKVIE